MDIDLTTPETFDHWTLVTMRFSDQDSMDHVNNVSIAAYVEQGRVAFFERLMDGLDLPGIDFVLASVHINFRRELHFPGHVDIGTRLIRLGNSSVATGIGIFRGGTCVATAESVNVFFDMTKRASIPVPAPVRARIGKDLEVVID